MKPPRIAAALLLGLLLWTACRSPAQSGTARAQPSRSSDTRAPVTEANRERAAATTPGTPGAASPARATGFEDTSWGMTHEELAAVYPDFPIVSAYIYGLEATVELVLAAGGLSRVAVSFAQYFPDMESCGRELERLRAALGEELGRSQTDNLSAVWLTESSEISLACDPGDDDLTHARMRLWYQPRSP